MLPKRKDYNPYRKDKPPLRPKKINYGRWIFLILLITMAITFFTRNNHRSVENPLSVLFDEPQQTKIEQAENIKFEKDGFSYDLEPLYEYEINGLVVNRFDYTWFSLTRTDNVFPIDLCMTWGNNIKNGTYRDRSVDFRQNGRWCFANWGPDINFDFDEVSNNHLVIDDKQIEKLAFSINEGDQIRIKGKLVNVEAENVDGESQKYEPTLSSWRSSTNRDDSGGGACEVIYVEELEILQKGNFISFWLFKISFWGLIIFVGWKILVFFWEVFRGK